MVEKVSMGKKVEALAEAFKFKEHFSSKIFYIYNIHNAIYFLLIKLRGFPVMNNLHVRIGRKLSSR